VNLYLSIFLIKLRDLQHIFELLFQLLFWVTPIFYELGTEPGQIGGRVGNIISYNPLGMMISIAREALINGNIAILSIGNTNIHSGWILLGVFVVAFVLIVTGRVYFSTHVRKIAEYF
ncbi:hypothetical protein KC717_00660, partial [Candidatus Dojkabacteria bacterium]|nr:hypothetical protein [Candidatus Dojkabacteria bacterium]